MPGAHSNGDVVNGENIPEWVSIFQQFWEHKKSHPSKSVQEEQRCEEHRMMQRTILPPAQPLGGRTNHIINETSTNRSRQHSSNSLIVQNGSMAVVPITTSAMTTPRPINSRHVSTGSLTCHGNIGNGSSNSASNMHPEISHFMEQ